MENEETLAMNILKMLRIGEPLVDANGGPFNKMTIAYPTHCFEVVKCGKYIYIVKRKISSH